MQYTLNLTAGQAQQVDYTGRVIVLEDTGAADSVSLRIRIPLQNDEVIGFAQRGWKARLLSGQFTRIEITAAVDAQVRLIVSDNDIEFNVFDGATVNAVITANPLPVSNDRGTPGNLMHVTGVTVADAPATGVSENAPVAVNDTVDLIAAADATRKAIRFCNIGTEAVALGPATQTWARRVIVLEPGDVWVEERAANRAWYGITDAGLATSVTWQGVTA